MSRTVPLSITRNLALYTQQWPICHTGLLRACEQDQDGTGLVMLLVGFRPVPARKLSAELYAIYHCYVYSEKLLMMERGTVRNM